MLNDLGFRSRVLLLTLLPSILLAVALGGYFTNNQLSAMRQQLQVHGEMIAEQLAPLAAPALIAGDQARLQRILKQALNQRDVRAVTTLALERRLIAHAGPDMLTPSPPSDPQAMTLVRGEHTTRILMPLLERHLHLAPSQDGDGSRLIGWLELELSHERTLVRGYRSLLASLLLVGIALLATALLALRTSRVISQPLRQVKEAVANLKDGQLETRLPPLGSREMDELAAGINRMAESLLNAREELQQSIEQATEDVRQNLETIEIQNIELDMARREALEASRIKSEFLANISHEIRTPLNGILGFTHLLQKGDLTSRQQDYLSTIEKSANSLLGIINEILDFSKIEAGKLMLENTPFNLRDLIEDTLTILAPFAHSKRLELVCLIYRDTPLQLVGDPLRLNQILTNLVSNAIKFTNRGNVVVRAMVEDESNERAQLRISVQDTGVGLTEQEIQQLFQAFCQADNSLSRQPGGTGLGLVISKRLIEQMGGEIGVDSTPQQGSDFWICLSLPKAKDDIEDLPALPLLGRQVALLEQHPLACQALQHQLEDCGLQVSTYQTLDELQLALSLAAREESPIDYVLLSLTSLDLPPGELPNQLRDMEALGCKCVLLCPTELSTQEQDQLEAHARLLSKPVDTRHLQRALLELTAPPRLVQPAPPQLPSRAPRILCVDDNPANLLLVKTLLGDMGAKVEAVDSGARALEAIARTSFDLVFMDMQMPGMDGRQTTEAIRRRESEQDSPPLPVVALTAHALASERRSLLQSGLDDYLTKPISERQLAQVVLKWTGLSLRQQPPGQAESSLPDKSPSILDPEEGLRLAAGKADLAEDMLRMLLAALPDDRQAIREARQASDREALLQRVHRLHGATRYCGVPQLRAACQRSETLLKQDHPAADAALDELDNAMQRLGQEAGITL